MPYQLGTHSKCSTKGAGLTRQGAEAHSAATWPSPLHRPGQGKPDKLLGNPNMTEADQPGTPVPPLNLGGAAKGALSKLAPQQDQ